MAQSTVYVVEEFLKKIKLSKYKNLLIGQGYSEYTDIFTMTEADLNSVHIMDATDRNTILTAGVVRDESKEWLNRICDGIRALCYVFSQIQISTWLKYYKLQEYERHFKNLGINTLEDLKQREMCDDMMDELEVMIPGHRKRLVMAASHTQSASRRKDPVACGYWGKNGDVAPTSETDFLWVSKCLIKSNIPGNDPVELFNCMVDTGSEVVTIKEDILSHLDLTFLQNINSKGIHKVEEKPLYRGVLVMGRKEIEVDVMPDSYNSVGCNVVKKFHHVIDGSKHFWLDPEN